MAPRLNRIIPCNFTNGFEYLVYPEDEVGYQSPSRKPMTNKYFGLQISPGCHRDSLELGSEERRLPSVSFLEAWGEFTHHFYQAFLSGNRDWVLMLFQIFLTKRDSTQERFLNSCLRRVESPPNFIFLFHTVIYISPSFQSEQNDTLYDFRTLSVSRTHHLSPYEGTSRSEIS